MPRSLFRTSFPQLSSSWSLWYWHCTLDAKEALLKLCSIVPGHRNVSLFKSLLKPEYTISLLEYSRIPSKKRAAANTSNKTAQKGSKNYSLKYKLNLNKNWMCKNAIVMHKHIKKTTPQKRLAKIRENKVNEWENEGRRYIKTCIYKCWWIRYCKKEKMKDEMSLSIWYT